MRYALAHREELLGFVYNGVADSRLSRLFLNFLPGGLCVSFGVSYKVDKSYESSHIFRLIDSEVHGTSVRYKISARRKLLEALAKCSEGEVRISQYEEGLLIADVPIKAEKIKVMPDLNPLYGQSVLNYPELRYSPSDGILTFSPDDVHYVRLRKGNLTMPEYKQIRNKFWPIKGKRTMTAPRRRGEAKPAPTTIPGETQEAVAPVAAAPVAAAPPAPAVVPIPVAPVAAAPVAAAPVAAAPVAAAPVAAAPIPPVVVDPLEDPVEPPEEEVAAPAPANPTPKDEGEDYQEEVAEAPEEEDETAPAVQELYRDKAPLKKEQNSADGLTAKGWLCVPNVFEGLGTQEILTAINQLDALRQAWTAQLVCELSDVEGISSDDHQAALDEVARLKKAVAALTA